MWLILPTILSFWLITKAEGRRLPYEASAFGKVFFTEDSVGLQARFLLHAYPYIKEKFKPVEIPCSHQLRPVPWIAGILLFPGFPFFSPPFPDNPPFFLQCKYDVMANKG